MKNNRPKLRLIIAPDITELFGIESTFTLFNPNYKLFWYEKYGRMHLKAFTEKLQNGKSYYNNEPPEAFKPTPVYRRKRTRRLKPKTGLKRYFLLKNIEHWY